MYVLACDGAFSVCLSVLTITVHVDPAGVPAEHLQGPGRQLPPGVTVWQVYSDYLQRLHAAAVGRIRTRRGADLFDRLSAAGKVQYIVTIPAGWQSECHASSP